jgi:hypothetical protein
VLVTDKHGNQRVETVNQELGMNKKDMNDIKNRLAKQGVDAANVDLYGGLDATDKPKARSGGAAPAAAAAAAAPRPSAADGSSRPATSVPAPRAAAPAAALSRGSPRPSSSSSFAPQAAVPSSGPSFDAFAAIRRVLYDPPVSYDMLGGRLQISVAATSPRVPMGAFLARISTLDSSLSRTQIQQMWRSLDPTNVGSIELTALYEILSSKFGKDKKSSGSGGVIERVIAKILERCSAQGGIKALGRTLAIMDTSGDKKLDKEELKYGLRDYGVELNIREMDEVFLYFGSSALFTPLAVLSPTIANNSTPHNPLARTLNAQIAIEAALCPLTSSSWASAATSTSVARSSFAWPLTFSTRTARALSQLTRLQKSTTFPKTPMSWLAS